MTSTSRVDIQQSSMEPLSQTDAVSGCSVINISGLDKMNQLTKAVSNLRPLLESFRQEQVMREQRLADLTEENNMLKEKIRQMKNLEYQSPDTQRDLYDEHVSLKSELQNTESLLQTERTNIHESFRQVHILHEQLENLRSSENGLMSENAKLKAASDEKQDILRSNELSYNKLYAEYTDLQKQLEELKSSENGLMSENEKRKADSDTKQDTLRSNELSYNKLYAEYTDLQKQLEELKSSENGLMSENEKLKADSDAKQGILRSNELSYNKLYAEYTDLQKQLEELKSSENGLMSENEKLKADSDAKQGNLRSNELAYNKLYAEYTDLESRIKTLVKDRDTCKTCADLYQSKLKETIDKEKRLLEQNKCISLERDELKKMIEDFKTDKRKLEDDVKETKKRLSQVMGTKLSADNPDIADLSDQNRPTKLAEKYSELYDNEWTDAFEVVDELSDEKQAIKTLLNLLQDIQRFCSDSANSQTENIRSAVTMTFSQDKPPSEYFSTQIKTFRRATSLEAIGSVVEHYMENLQRNDSAKYNFVNQRSVKPFVHKCLELCWLMAVQCPPVVFAKLTELEGQERFDSTTYKPYTKTGAFFDFVVWPPLYLHKNGPLLAKGVAQARGMLSSKDVKPVKNSKASALQGTAVPVNTNTSNAMTRSFNVKSSSNSMSNFSKTVDGASDFFDNFFSPPEPKDSP